MADNIGVLPIQYEQPQGIMGYLRDPYIRAALAGASQGFAQAAQSGQPGVGYALSQGLAGAAQGGASWEEQQAREAADRVKEMAAARRGETDYRYQLNLIAERKMRDDGMSRDDALIAAQQEMAARPFEQRKELAAQGYEQNRGIELLKYKLDNNLEITKRDLDLAYAPQIEASKERAKAEAAVDVERDVESQGAESAIDMMANIKRNLSRLPSPLALKAEGVKAFIGLPDEDIQDALGRISTDYGAMIEYVKKLPGAATDREFPVFMASAGIVVDENLPKERRIAAADQAMRNFEAIIRRQEQRNTKSQVPQQPGAKQDRKRIKIDAQGNIR